jgi:hypothetical protein
MKMVCPWPLAHPHLPIEAVQFHPESVLTPEGPVMFRNWINLVEAHRPSIQPTLSSVPVWLDPEDIE